MALKLNERYPSRFDNPSADYPQGSFKNRTTPTAKDGSYLEKDWANDKEGFFQSLLTKVGVTANGLVDKVGGSQYFDALLSIFATQATEAVIGVAKVATQPQTNTGTDDATFVTPKKLKNGFLFSISTNGYIIFPSWAGGWGVQWGVVASLASGVPLTQALPVSFANNLLWCLAGGSDATNNNALACNAAPISTSSIRLAQAYGSAMSARYVAIGN